ncbi:HlyD family efflux transporter periplasmic adaptor subunit [Selenihalanaerobacter shriftii]|uniref:HlyD family efflux transporter periplasmic adaptor subunit n=1 Tax=Selenihalanaerobacter shriftii TaxID=142842 RepID=UPI00099AA0C0|nr:HlyD family efflux transporter periplasmic adaptor subunit [Selenihalanaerobacter shriftii]
MKNNYKKRRRITKEEKDLIKEQKNIIDQSAKLTKVLVTFILFIIFLSFVVNLFIHSTSRTVLTRQGQLIKAIEGEGLFIRNEKITIAPISGKLEIKVQEGQRVSANTLIANIKNNQTRHKLYTYNSGVVSYHIDGLESSLTIDNLKRLNYDRYKKLRYKVNQVNDGEKLNNGRPIFKIVENYLLYLIMPLSKNKSYLFEAGTEVRFELLEKEIQKKFSAKVDHIIESKPKDLLVLRVESFPPLFLNLRKTDVKLIRSSYNGITVPISALVKKGSKTGVMVIQDDKHSFKEIKVVSKGEEKAIVKGVGLGIQILEKPKQKMEG